MKLDGTIEPLNNQTIITHHRWCRCHQFFGWLPVASLAYCPIVLAGCKINTTMLCLTPLLLLCESLSCRSSLALDGCWIAALVTYRPQCPVVAILEFQRQRSTQAQLIDVCKYIPLSWSLAASPITFLPISSDRSLAVNINLRHRPIDGAAPLVLLPPLPVSLKGWLLSKK